MLVIAVAAVVVAVAVALRMWGPLVVPLFGFFFQAEDGIRDVAVTGVQTCALPIFRQAGARLPGPGAGRPSAADPGPQAAVPGGDDRRGEDRQRAGAVPRLPAARLRRSEERRVGKECRSRWSAYH